MAVDNKALADKLTLVAASLEKVRTDLIATASTVGEALAVTLSVRNDLQVVVPVPPTLVVTQVVHPMALLTDCIYLERGLAVGWKKQMGDWRDANGVFNGPKPTRSPSGTVAVVDITGLGDVLIQDAHYITAVTIDGVDAKAFFTDPTANRAFYVGGAVGHSSQPIVVTNDGGKSMTVTSTRTGTYRVDAVATPPAIVPAPVSGYTPPDLLRINPTSDTAMRTPGSVAGPDGSVFPGVHTYETEQGVPYCKAHCPARYYPVIGNGRVARCDYPLPPQTELYVAFLLYIGDRVAYAVQDLGVKLSGMMGDEGRWNIGEHTNAGQPVPGVTKNPRNLPILALRDYYYSAEATAGQGAGNGQFSPFSFGFLASPGWTLIELGARANTFNADGTPNSDGFKRTWINGNLVDDRAIKWFANVTSRWNKATLQIYHGGTQSYGEDCIYGIGPVMASTKHIGVDPAFEALLKAS